MLKFAKRWLSILLVVAYCAATGCCNVVARPVPAPMDLNDGSMQIKVDSKYADKDNWSVKFKFFEWDDEYDHWIQEVHLSNGMTLVEVFWLRNGRMLSCRVDHHRTSWDHPPEGVKIRSIYSYMGRVEGVDWNAYGTFAHLPQNRDGSIKTTITDEFNTKYQERNETRGRIVADNRSEGFWWSIRFEEGKLSLQIPEANTYSEK